MGLFKKFKDSLKKTRDSISEQFENLAKSFSKIDEDLLEELEEILIMSDVGVETSMLICEKVKKQAKESKAYDTKDLKLVIYKAIEEIMIEDEPMAMDTPLNIILVIGVNGVGKTTTIGKLAQKYKNEGKKVILAAGDTFRAAAIEQLETWANRSGVDIIKHQSMSDPAAVVFDSISSAKSKNADILIIDTAGRLHNKKNLMDELSKINRIVENGAPQSNFHKLLVLDATTGQNAVIQAKQFNEIIDINGLVLTKLDGTAKGGIVISIKNELNLPVRFVGVGEGIDDLQEFNPKDYANALFDVDENSDIFSKLKNEQNDKSIKNFEDMKIILASNNNDKVSEFNRMLKGCEIEFKTLKEVDFLEKIEETEDTFKGNAILKAMTVFRKTGIPTLADDSGLVVDSLNGSPGVKSARFSGENATDDENNCLLLERMNGKTDRNARFVCVLALVLSETNIVTTVGECNGVISESLIGSNGFGYDSLFLVNGKSFGEMDREEKDTMSHRSKALAKMKEEMLNLGIIK